MNKLKKGGGYLVIKYRIMLIKRLLTIGYKLYKINIEMKKGRDITKSCIDPTWESFLKSQRELT